MNILAVLRFEIPLERETFRLNPFGTFRETFIQGNDATSILTSEKPSALKMISNANSALVQNKLIFFSWTVSISYLDGRDPMFIGYWLSDYRTETKNDFDGVTRRLK